MLYCKVTTKELGQTLGRHLYEQVTLTGTGIYFLKTWELMSMPSVYHAAFPKLQSFDDFVEQIRGAGGDGWDGKNIDEELGLMR